MSQACAQWRGDIGAYIVGALGSSASADVRKHLRACGSCRSEYEDLLPVRDWLTQVRGANGSASRRKLSGPVLRAVGPVRAKKSRRWLAAIPVAAAAAAVGVLSNLGASPSVSAFNAADHATGVHGQARLLATPAGTRITLTVKGLPADERCRLVAISRRKADVAASWSARYDGTARVVGTSAIPEHQLAALRVESAGHKLLLTIWIASHG
ncbi:MAG: zf-HC2 domain-containing protein [Streptosporangiaceae bacterium]